MASPVLAFGSEQPVDLLCHAACVVRFLSDVSPAMAQGGGNLGLNEESACGLSLILMVVESTITEAMARL